MDFNYYTSQNSLSETDFIQQHQSFALDNPNSNQEILYSISRVFTTQLIPEYNTIVKQEDTIDITQQIQLSTQLKINYVMIQMQFVH